MKKTLLTAAAVALATGAALGQQSNADLERRIAKLEKELTAKYSTSSFGKTTLGGYGELHYNDTEGQDSEIDFHRFVLFINHEFNKNVRFVSEVELEHSLAGDNKPGEVELEQAYIEVDLKNDWQVRGGLFLIPVGHLNEHHEPPTFFGVERNFVEKNIIPTTWWEGGAGFTKKTEGGFIFDGAITSGLNVNNGNYSIRSGRQKVAEANGDNKAVTLRATYIGTPGLKVSVFGQYNTDIIQDEAGSQAGTLYGATLDYQNGGFGLRALYAGWDIDGEGSALPTDAESQSGWYIEPSYTWELSGDKKIGVFARYADAEYYKSGAKDENVTTVGVNYWPHSNVVLKADFQTKDDGATDTDTINLGIGYQF